MLEAQVVVEMTGQMFLDAEEAWLPPAGERGTLSPAGSGDLVKSRLALYFSRAIRILVTANGCHP